MPDPMGSIPSVSQLSAPTTAPGPVPAAPTTPAAPTAADLPTPRTGSIFDVNREGLTGTVAPANDGDGITFSGAAFIQRSLSGGTDELTGSAQVGVSGTATGDGVTIRPDARIDATYIPGTTLEPVKDAQGNPIMDMVDGQLQSRMQPRGVVFGVTGGLGLADITRTQTDTTMRQGTETSQTRRLQIDYSGVTGANPTGTPGSPSVISTSDPVTRDVGSERAIGGTATSTRYTGVAANVMPFAATGGFFQDGQWGVAAGPNFSIPIAEGAQVQTDAVGIVRAPLWNGANLDLTIVAPVQGQFTDVTGAATIRQSF